MYAATIVTHDSTDDDHRKTVTDLETTLERITGFPFDVTIAPEQAACSHALAIHLAIVSDLSAWSAPGAVVNLARALERPGEFAIHSAPTEGMWIVAQDFSGLSRGVYEYLDRLGVRWYLPNEHWTIVPRADSVRLAISALRKPALRTVLVAPEFGFGGALLRSQASSSEQQWQAWKRRNRFPNEYTPPGQVGGDFNLAEKAELERISYYRPQAAGKRSAWSRGMKWNFTFNGCGSPPGPCDPNSKENPHDYDGIEGGTVRLLGEWARKRYKSEAQAHVSIEVPDGIAPYCDCDKCRDLLRKAYPQLGDQDSTASDRVFHLARQVARYLEKHAPELADDSRIEHAGVGLLAYNRHLAPPRLPLLPNMYVFVVPYGPGTFTGLTPANLIREWSEKRRTDRFHLGLSIPLTMDRPNVSPYAFADLLESWRQSGVEGLTLSSTLAAGETGIPFWVLSRKLWDPTASTDEMLRELFARAFGRRAGASIRRMFDRWWKDAWFSPERVVQPWLSGFLLDENELALSVRDLGEAEKAVGTNTEARARLQDIEDYLEYLRLRLLWEGSYTGTINSAHDRATAQLARHLYAMYAGNFAQPWRLFRRSMFAGVDCNAPQQVGQEVCREWHPYVGTAYSTAARRRPHTELRALRVQVEPIHYGSRLVPLFSESTSLGTVMTDWFRRPQLFSFVTSGGEFTIRIHSRLRRPPPPTVVGGLEVFIRDRHDREMQHRLLRWEGSECQAKADGSECVHDFVFSALAAGEYRLQVDVSDYSGQNYSLEVPRRLPFSLVGHQHGEFTREQYFFVPRGTKRFGLAVRNAPGSEPVFRSNLGSRVPARKSGQELYLVDVPTGGDNSVWSMSGLRAYAVSYRIPYKPATLVGVPSIFAFSRDQLLVPADAR